MTAVKSPENRFFQFLMLSEEDSKVNDTHRTANSDAGGLLRRTESGLNGEAMDLAMRLPIKVSTATSNFMIGVTAAASAGVYFMRGDIDPFVAAPVAAGVVVGATIGSRLLSVLQSRLIRIVFVTVLLWVSLQMLIKGLQG